GRRRGHCRQRRGGELAQERAARERTGVAGRATRPRGSPPPPRLPQLGDQGRPAGLVTGADASSVVAVEVLVEEQQIAPVRVGLEFLSAAVDGTATIGVPQEDAS